MKTSTYSFLFLLSFLSVQVFGQDSHVCSHGKMHTTIFETATLDDYYINLTKGYDVNFYQFDIHLERTSAFISGNVEIHANTVIEELDTFLFELHEDLVIDSILINGEESALFSRIESAVIVPVEFVLDESFFVRIYYEGLPSVLTDHSLEASGLNNRVSPAWGNQITYSLSQPFGAYLWFPCKQDLTDKADSLYMSVTTDASNVVGSNGLLNSVTDLPEGKQKYFWKSTNPIDYYLISVAVGQYVDYTIYAEPDGEAPIMIQNFVYDNPETLPYYLDNINQTADFLEYYSTLFGSYPFANEKYGQAMAPSSYALEHQTMTTAGAFQNILTAHELAHQWFGNNVTCASWADIWLNEGFASYAELLMYEEFDPFFIPTHLSENHFLITGIPYGSVWVSDSLNREAIFDGRLVYAKGAMIIHTLRFLMNDDVVFFQTLKSFQEMYGGGTASATDFKEIAEAESGLDLTDFFEEWYYGEGYPTYHIAYDEQEDGTVFLQLTQEVAMPDVTPYFTNDLELRIIGVSGEEEVIRLENIDGVVSNHYFSFPEEIAGISIDPDNWIINKDGEITKVENLALEDVSNAELLLYPNPAEDVLYIEGINTPTNFTVSNLKGQIIMSGKLNDYREEIELKTLPSGTYLLRLENGNEFKFNRD